MQELSGFSEYFISYIDSIFNRQFALTRQVKVIQCANQYLKIHFANSRLCSLYYKAISHLEVPIKVEEKEIFDLYVFEISDFGYKKCLHLFLKEMMNNVAQKTKAAQNSYVGNSICFEEIAYYYNTESNFGLWFVQNVEGLSEWHFANPFRFLFQDWLSSIKLQVTHAAAISDSNGAVLLSGRSGSGKSTTSFACLEEGFNFLGDDHCVLGSSENPRVYSMYNSLKINLEFAEKFPSLQNMQRKYIENENKTKAVFYLGNRGYNEINGVPIKAVLKIRVCNSRAPRLSSISKREALKDLLFSTVQQCSFISQQRAVSNLQEIVENTDCYEMGLCEDMKENTKMIRDVLQR